MNLKTKQNDKVWFLSLFLLLTFHRTTLSVSLAFDSVLNSSELDIQAKKTFSKEQQNVIHNEGIAKEYFHDKKRTHLTQEETKKENKEEEKLELSTEMKKALDMLEFEAEETPPERRKYLNKDGLSRSVYQRIQKQGRNNIPMLNDIDISKIEEKRRVLKTSKNKKNCVWLRIRPYCFMISGYVVCAKRKVPTRLCKRITSVKDGPNNARRTNDSSSTRTGNIILATDLLSGLQAKLKQDEARYTKSRKVGLQQYCRYVEAKPKCVSYRSFNICEKPKMRKMCITMD